MQLSETPRTRLTRLAERGRTEVEDLYAVLDAGLVGHLGLVRDGAPAVLPMGYGRRGDTLYLHGSSGAGWARLLDGAAVCFTVTHVDGVVYARSVFDHSLNYRSAVVLGTTRRVDDADEKWDAVEAVTEQTVTRVVVVRPVADQAGARRHRGVRPRAGRGQRTRSVPARRTTSPRTWWPVDAGPVSSPSVRCSTPPEAGAPISSRAPPCRRT